MTTNYNGARVTLSHYTGKDACLKVERDGHSFFSGMFRAHDVYSARAVLSRCLWGREGFSDPRCVDELADWTTMAVERFDAQQDSLYLQTSTEGA